MARNRVLSFMSSFSNRDSQQSPIPTSSIPNSLQPARQEPPRQDVYRQEPNAPPHAQQPWAAESRDSAQASSERERVPGERVSSRPMSIVQTYQPPLMELTQDTPPELQPIFTFLNSHGNKLYQEGYFLKLDDQNSQGKPNADRTWTECFAQLVGTILSLWDAAELDAAGQDGEVLPKFINLTDASIKMIEALPTRSNDDQPLQNVLSISTAGKNRYLLHFNSHHSLIQWTAGIRLAMFEHSSLQEAYTGALIAGKGKTLNNINVIMERSRTKYEDWVRVRFGAGTPWRRCWCVITPPDEREYQKLQKEMKKKSAYDRVKPPVLKGDVKFYATKKTKKVQPMAQITNAYSAFAIYPQSKPLIDASTLVKLEGIITIHTSPPTSMEGFVFVMPEVHPAVSGFEMMLRWLFPVWDTFALYGRPARLFADTVNPKSLMFAMPQERRYGYLEILDVSGLILTDGSQNWSEMEWRRNLKELTARRMSAIADGSRGSRYSSRRSNRNSFGPPRSKVEFNDGSSIKSNQSISLGQGQTDASLGGAQRIDSAPHATNTLQPPSHSVASQHYRSVSESQGLDRYQSQGVAVYDGDFESSPTPPPHGVAFSTPHQGSGLRYERDMLESPDRPSSEDELPASGSTVHELQDLRDTASPEPVAAPPAFAHAPGTLPVAAPYHPPELRIGKSRLSNSTLAQMAGAGGMATGAGLAAASNTEADSPRTSEDQRRQNTGRYSEDRYQRVVLSDANTRGMNTNPAGLTEGLVDASNNRLSFERQAPPAGEDSHFHSTPRSQQYQSSNTPSYNMASAASSHFNPSEPQYSMPSGLSVPTSTSHSQSAFAPVIASQSASIHERPQSQAYTSSTDSTRSQPSRLQTNQSILRKPLSPQNRSTTPDKPLLQSASSSGSLENVIDQAGFDRVIPRDHIYSAQLAPEIQIHHRGNTDSLAEDAVSQKTPDYASTRASTETRESVERPRTGVMRTVGRAEQERPQDSARASELSSAIPTIDFGPTINFAPNQISGNSSPPGKASPASRQSPARPVGPPGRNAASPEVGQHRNDSSANPGGRTVAWQPGMAAVRTNSPGRQAITPEQFVQQRAAAATPLYAHQRQPSANLMRSGPPTPPLGRNQTGEYFSHSRNSSGDMFQRPNSRGSSAALGVSGTGDYSAHLSAREQEYVARVTGSPLINLPAGNSRGASPNSGLIGAIDAREKEKRDIKQGLNSQAVQQAIVQRQQQTQAQGRGQAQPPYQGIQQYPEQYAGQAGVAQAPYSGGGQYQNSANAQQYPSQPPRQQQYTSPAVSVFAQGGGWSSSQQRASLTPEQQQQQQYTSPAASVFAQGGGWSSSQQRASLTPEQQQQQQYFQQQQQQQQQQGQGRGRGRGRGRGQQGYQGQGF